MSRERFSHPPRNVKAAVVVGWSLTSGFDLGGEFMSVFTNPASSAADHAKEYVTAVLRLVSDQDPIKVLRETPAQFERQIRDLSGTQIFQREAPGKWSVNEVLQHLSDSELVFGFRLRMVLAHDRPTLTSYDQDLWADRLNYREGDPQQALALFTALRRAHLKLLERTSDTDLQRVGVHVERGEQTLEEMVRLYAGHDLVHVRQIERIRRVVS
jgi:hypothetical protein